MIRKLDTDALNHDDPNHPRHARDKRMAEERRRWEYTRTPAVEREASVALVDRKVFKLDDAGGYFRINGTTAQRVQDPAAYRRWITKQEKLRRKYRRQRIRDGRPRWDTGELRTGVVSMVVTPAPWHVPFLARIPKGESEALMLRMAEIAAETIEKRSGRETAGGGLHYDTGLPHLHLHIFQTSRGTDGQPGERCDKADFLVAGGWNVGAARLERKFPGMLSDKKRQMLADNLAKKDHARRPCVDLLVAEAIDAFVEDYMRQGGPERIRRYERDCEEYRKKKLLAQRTEQYKRITQAGLIYHSETGVWPLCYRAMSREAKLAMWRLLPKELRLGIRASIITYQLVRDPLRGVLRATKEFVRAKPLAFEHEPARPEINLLRGPT